MFLYVWCEESIFDLNSDICILLIVLDNIALLVLVFIIFYKLCDFSKIHVVD